VVKLLLACGAQVDYVEQYGYTPLIWSSKNGHKEVVKLLLADGADVHREKNNGYTSLRVSRQNGHPEVAKLLMANITAIRRFTVLFAIRQVRLLPPTPPPSQLLSLLANRTPDDVVRVILEFLGAQLELCGKCGREAEKMQKCSVCKLVRYCSRECQRQDWKEHKKSCKKAAARKEGGKGN
jgi:hypothetical protein